MLVLAGHEDTLAGRRMERIGNHGFERQKSGTMAPAQTVAASGGRSWRH